MTKVLDTRIIQKLSDCTKKPHEGVALQAMRCLGVLCVYNSFQKVKIIFCFI